MPTRDQMSAFGERFDLPGEGEDRKEFRAEISDNDDLYRRN